MKNARVWFTKDDEAKYISHLDLVRTMSRALQQSGLPVWMTEGFHPHLFLTFPLPLSLGICGKREAMDVKLTEDIKGFQIKEALCHCLPKGICIFDVTEPVMPAKKISYALYAIVCENEMLSNREIENMLCSFFAKDSIPCEKKSKSGIQEIDLKEHIAEYQIIENKEKIKLLVTLSAGSKNNINPSLLLQAIEKEYKTEFFWKITRCGLYNEKMEPFR